MAAARSAAGSLIAAALSVLAAAGMAAVTAALTVSTREGGAGREVVVAADAMGVVVMLVGVVFHRGAAVGWAVALLAAAYAAGLASRGAGIDPAAPLIGLGLLLVAELGYTACELRGPHATDPAHELHRWALLTVVGGGGALAGAAAMVVAARLPGSVTGLVAGSVAAVALLAVILWLRRRGLPA